ncbi:hypothetical protein [Sphingomonas sp. Leaf412]|uniref:hypothetical protein n=1 Tax=Sphingomonas sp. Leaf412 TaxID=1736370 RepID=UPI000A82EF69|nr:hypothetical protein [Sphingomonas sp. Leaf412]
MTRGLAEMQTNLLAAALPEFGGRVDQFMVFTLLARRTFDDGRPIPVLAVADSLRLPFETTRRHVAALAARGLCRRERGGVMLTGTLADAPMATLVPLAHDCLVRFIADLATAGGLPCFTPSARDYSWKAGWPLAADLMLAAADSNRRTHQDRVNLALFSTILCANNRAISADPHLSRRHATIAPPPPDLLIRPLRARVLSERLAMPKATVRRRVEQLLAGPVRQRDGGLVVDDAWYSSPDVIATSRSTWGNMRRLLTPLATHGFPFHDPERAYRVGRPAFVPLD